MRLSFLNISFLSASLLLCILFFSCDKASVPFNTQINGTPNLTYFQNFQVSLQTLQIDSFVTSGRQVFSVGYRNDSVFGSIHAGSFMQVNLPANPFLDATNVVFDSLQLIMKPNGVYFGDTTKPFTFNIYQLTQPVQNVATTNNPNAATLFFNTSSLNYNPVPIGTSTYPISPKKGDSVAVRLSDAVGQDLFSKFQSGATEVSSQANFINYFDGLYIDADTTSQTAYNFTPYSSSVVMRLYYDINGATTIHTHLDFTYNTAEQFNHISYNHPAGTPLSIFTPYQTNELVNSVETNHQAFLSSSTGYFIKVSFPDILKLKAMYSYVKVVSAELVIPQSPAMYAYPNVLPPTVDLYATDINNNLNGVVIGSNGALQNGNLFIDYLYGQSTHYSYDVTNFITQLLNQPNTDSLALLLTPSSPLGDNSFSRLIVNDQSQGINGVQLKLYVLGL